MSAIAQKSLDNTDPDTPVHIQNNLKWIRIKCVLDIHTC